MLYFALLVNTTCLLGQKLLLDEKLWNNVYGQYKK